MALPEETRAKMLLFLLGLAWTDISTFDMTVDHATYSLYTNIAAPMVNRNDIGEGGTDSEPVDDVPPPPFIIAFSEIGEGGTDSEPVDDVPPPPCMLA